MHEPLDIRYSDRMLAMSFTLLLVLERYADASLSVLYLLYASSQYAIMLIK